MGWDEIISGGKRVGSRDTRVQDTVALSTPVVCFWEVGEEWREGRTTDTQSGEGEDESPPESVGVTVPRVEKDGGIPGEK